jgi:HD superfamily phosphohydrolase
MGQLPLNRSPSIGHLLTNRPKSITIPFVPGSKLELSPTELLLVNTRTFQRLFEIKQLGFTYFVYPGATHVRAEHLLHSVAETQQMINALKRNGFRDQIEPYEEKIRAAALLHDITQVPFGHTLEDELGVLDEHDKSLSRIHRVFKSLEDEIEETAEYLDKAIERPSAVQRKKAIELVRYARRTIRTIHFLECLASDDPEIQKWAKEQEPLEIERDEALKPEECFVADIVGNTISADLLAYLKLDLERTGLGLKVGWAGILNSLVLAKNVADPDRLRLAIRITRDGLRNDVIGEIFDILQARLSLTDRVYYHHAKCAADAMLGKLLHICDIKKEGPDIEALERLGDEGLFSLLALKITKMPEGEKREAAERLLKGLRQRRLYKRILVASASDPEKPVHPSSCTRWTNPQQRAEAERRIEDMCGLDYGSVIIFCPRNMQLKEASVMVVYERSDGTLSDAEPLRFLRPEALRRIRDRVRAQEDLYREIWRLYVFFDPRYAHVAPFIESTVEKELGLQNSPLFHATLRSKAWYKASLPIYERVKAIEASEPGLESYVSRTLISIAERGDFTHMRPEDIIDIARQRRQQSI